MDYCTRIFSMAVLLALAVIAPARSARSQEPWHFIFPEQRCMEIRDPSQMPQVRLPEMPAPTTVSQPRAELQPWNLSLDEAIRIALENADVIRVLGGSSGRTIYDPAITNTQIDQARGRFDPAVTLDNNFSHRDVPGYDELRPDPLFGVQSDSYDMSLGLSKQTVTGGTAGLNVNTQRFYSPLGGAALNPQIDSSTSMSFTQPLLQDAGPTVNLAPIVIARIDTERSFFQMKDSVQELVRGVIDAYWALVSARTDVWVRGQQIEQGLWSEEIAGARLEVGIEDIGPVAQAGAALAGFRSGLVTARANQLQREASLRNILGLPPVDSREIVPITLPSTEWPQESWEDIVGVAQVRRPDLIELKLVIEADQQRLLMARNQALPSVDVVALYRWDGLQGRTPGGLYVSSGPGQFTGWQLGVNFSVPIGLRESRANLRRQELLIARDRVDLDQALHNAVHRLAATYRNMAQFYEQYRVSKEEKEAALISFGYQQSHWEEGGTQTKPVFYLNVLQAITQLGNAHIAEAQSLTQYNTEMANLQREAGAILEAHGVRFSEEWFASIGPAGRLFNYPCYPRDMRPGPNAKRYQDGTEPSEHFFELDEARFPQD
jgi:outer membrane protein TolC